MNPTWTDLELDQLIREFIISKHDIDGDGKLNYEEFVSYMLNDMSEGSN